MGLKQNLMVSVLPIVTVGVMAAAMIGISIQSSRSYNSMLTLQRNFYERVIANQQELQETLQVAAEKPEVFQESIKPENAIPARDVTGRTLDYSLGDLIRKSSFVVSYPEPITVDPVCLEKKVNDPTQRGMVQDVGVAPRLVGPNQLTGFSVWANKAGTGYTNMGKDILRIGYSCQQ